MGLESKTLRKVLDYLCDEIGGDWLLTGGALVRLKFDENRGTEDIDLVRIRHPNLSDEAAKQQLFKWLIHEGLGPEWVNSAVEPFVQEVPNWRDEMVLIESKAKGKIFRPNFTLFVYLKLRRGTEVDLADILKGSEKCDEGFDEKKFLIWADEKLKLKFQKLRPRLKL